MDREIAQLAKLAPKPRRGRWGWESVKESINETRLTIEIDTDAVKNQVVQLVKSMNLDYTIDPGGYVIVDGTPDQISKLRSKRRNV